MSKHKHENGAHHEPETEAVAPADEPETAADETEAPTGSSREQLVAGAATVGVVAVGVALIEIAWLPGLVLGVAAALAPKYLPALGTGLKPLVRSTVRSAYKAGRKARETVAEAQEHLHDLAAEVRSEEVGPVTGATSSAAAESAPAHS